MLIKILRAAVSVPVNCNRQAETATLLERLVKSVTEENESEALHLCGPANPEAPKPLLTKKGGFDSRTRCHGWRAAPLAFLRILSYPSRESKPQERSRAPLLI